MIKESAVMVHDLEKLNDGNRLRSRMDLLFSHVYFLFSSAVFRQLVAVELTGVVFLFIYLAPNKMARKIAEFSERNKKITGLAEIVIQFNTS